MAKKKVESKKAAEVPDVIYKEVVGEVEAEALQEAGWDLVSASQVGVDARGLTEKKYKFKKGGQ